MQHRDRCPKCGAPMIIETAEGICPACLRAAKAPAVAPIQSPQEPAPAPEIAAPDSTRPAQQAQPISPVAIDGVRPKGGESLGAGAATTILDGQSLEVLLKERKDPSDALSRYLAIFERLCEAMAAAHSVQVAHRNLEPAKINVGRFGEVQVTGWRKSSAEKKEGTEAAVIRDLRSEADVEGAIASGLLPNLAYASPQRARGDQERVDTRTDVFALGAILVEILTGSPLYSGTTRMELLRKAILGDVSDAKARLMECGADRGLINIAASCLGNHQFERPRDAGVLVDSLAEYREKCAQRLRDAEKGLIQVNDEAERVRVRAAKERRLSWMTFGLAGLLMILSGAGVLAWRTVNRARSARAAALSVEVNSALQQVALLRGLARNAKTGDPKPWDDVRAAAEHAQSLFSTGSDPKLRQQVDELVASVKAEQAIAQREQIATQLDRQLLEQIVDLRSAWSDDRDGTARDAAFTEIFRRIGLDVEVLSAEETATKIKSRPANVVSALAADLDAWALLRSARNDVAAAKQLMDISRLVDPDAWRNRLRDILSDGKRDKQLLSVQSLARAAPVAVLPPQSLAMLGATLDTLGDQPAALELLMTSERNKPNDLWVNFNLAVVLQRMGRVEESIRYYTAARAIKPEAAHALAHALEARGELDEAIAIFKDLTRVRPEAGWHAKCLKMAEAARGNAGGANASAAIRAKREKVAEKPDDPRAHFELGFALLQNRQLEAAISEFRDTIRLDSNNVDAHNNLATALMAKGQVSEALAEFNVATRIRPNFADGFSNLGVVYARLGRANESITAYREAIRLEPTRPVFHFGLGNALRASGQLDAAIAAYREAVKLKPDYLEALNNLGAAYGVAGQLDDAVKAYNEAIKRAPQSPEGYLNLGFTLRKQGKLQESLDSLKKGHELGSRRSGWALPSEEWIRDGEKMVALLPRLPAVASGTELPANPEEGVVFARLCAVKSMHAASARLFREAFNQKPDLAESIESGDRFEAAMNAVRAGSGEGQDMPRPDDAARAKLRTQAREWLEAELQQRLKPLKDAKPDEYTLLARILENWRTDRSLSAVRDDDKLASMPEAERAAWKAFWSEVARVIAKANTDESAGKVEKDPKQAAK